MSAPLLVLNAGSSTLKLALYRCAGDGVEEGARGLLEDAGDAAAAMARVRSWLGDHAAGERLACVGHRVVHGGPRFAEPALVDEGLLGEIEKLVPLAPLHLPQSLAALRAVDAAFPGVPQVVCFDTAFHRTQPAVATLFGLPRSLHDEGIHRYGFHGLSYEYVASVLPRLDPRLAVGRVVVAHLGSGASMCALRGGKSVATTMSFTPLDGLPMATRSGALDPGVLLYLMRRDGLDADALEDLLYHRSGLLGVSGVSGDMRELLASPDRRAADAVELFVYRIARELGSLVAALGGLDALVFTGGIGEHAAPVRERVCRDAAWLGVELDEQANRAGAERISRLGRAPSVWIVRTDEELVIARAAWKVVAAEDLTPRR